MMQRHGIFSSGVRRRCSSPTEVGAESSSGKFSPPWTRTGFFRTLSELEQRLDHLAECSGSLRVLMVEDEGAPFIR